MGWIQYQLFHTINNPIFPSRIQLFWLCLQFYFWIDANFIGQDSFSASLKAVRNASTVNIQNCLAQHQRR